MAKNCINGAETKDTPGGITRRDALKLAAGFGVALGTLPVTASAEEAASEDSFVPNSWRYDDGVLRTDVEPEGISLYSSTPAWGRDESGNWCNSVGTPIPGALLRGVDVSEHQGDIDWDTVKSSGDIDYAIIRAAAFEGSTSSRDGKDYKWDRNVSACERLGIPYGAYIYSYATTVEGARREADCILGLLKGHAPTYPIFLDMEDSSTLSESVDLNQIAAAFCERIEAAGYQAGIYSNLNWWTNYLTSSTLNNWVRWVAQYNVTCDYQGHYDMWQATSKGSVAGIKGNVDLNFDFVGLSSESSSQTTWVRVYGQHDLDTMAKISQQGWSSSDAVVIATRDTYWDALSASALAGLYGCPILLTTGSALSSQTKSEIQRLGAKTAYVIGGPIAIASGVDGQIKAAGCPNVVRVYGQDQQGTARKIAQQLIKAGHTDTCIVATSWKFQDALSVSPYAYAAKAPIFLCETGSNTLSEESLAIIRSAGFKKALIVGGTIAVNKDVEGKLRSAGISSPERIWGQTEYETSEAIAKWEIAQGMGSSHMAVATGLTYFDALAGGALCGKNNSVLVITSDYNRHCLTSFVPTQKDKVEKGYVFGGEIAVSKKSWLTLLRYYLY